MLRRALLTTVAIGLCLRIAYAVAIYEPSLLPYNLDDFISYKNAANDILNGDLAFSNSLYLKRPPAYALLVAALGIQPGLIIAVNLLLGLSVIPLTYHIARQLALPTELALLAAFFVALDPASIRASVVLRADALANFWLALAFLSLLRLRSASAVRETALWGALSGTLIILSALTRPASYLLWIPAGIWLVIAQRGGASAHIGNLRAGRPLPAGHQRLACA